MQLHLEFYRKLQQLFSFILFLCVSLSHDSQLNIFGRFSSFACSLPAAIVTVQAVVWYEVKSRCLRWLKRQKTFLL